MSLSITDSDRHAFHEKALKATKTIKIRCYYKPTLGDEDRSMVIESQMTGTGADFEALGRIFGMVCIPQDLRIEFQELV